MDRQKSALQTSTLLQGQLTSPEKVCSTYSDTHRVVG